jgi:uncharacterized protein YggE
MHAKLATLALLACTSVASANITVTGNGKVVFVPNMARVYAGVTSDGKTAGEAWRQNGEVVKKLFQVLKAQGIDPKDAKTTGLNITPKYEYAPYKQPVLVGYAVSYNLEIVVHKLDRLGKLLDSLVDAGANRGMNIQFTHDKLDELLDQARVKAAAQARRKAELYAKGAGTNVGNVLSIYEANPVYPRPYYFERMAKADASLPIAAGQQELSVNVTVTFALKNG